MNYNAFITNMFNDMIEQELADAQAQLMEQAVRTVAPNAPDPLVQLAAQSSGKEQSDMLEVIALGSIFGLF